MEIREIKTEEDIYELIFTFYGKVRKDDLLSPIFMSKIADDEWDIHLSKMIRFWSSMLLYTRTYSGDPMSKHFALPIGEAHFLQWLKLFHMTIDELFTGKIAEDAKLRANGIGRIMGSTLGVSPDSELFEKKF
jgi:hemoglobin